jgi:membrane-associated phospholipid phosphatase
MLLDKKNIDPLNFADYISALPVAYVFYMFYMLVKTCDRFYVIGFTGLMTSLISADFLKRLPYPKSWEFFTLRPEGANNWDILSRNDYSNKINPPGFPSGHMSTVAFFSVYMLISSKNNKLEKAFLISLIVLTGWARWIKGVHNLPQILTGTVLGSGIAYLFSKLLL